MFLSFSVHKRVASKDLKKTYEKYKFPTKNQIISSPSFSLKLNRLDFIN